MKYLPSFTICFSEGPDDPCHELVAGRHFHLGLDAVGPLFWANPSRRLLDLLRIATSIYVVDRLAKRKRQSHEPLVPVFKGVSRGGRAGLLAESRSLRHACGLFRCLAQTVGS